ncbi:MAG: hypothetical protein HY364_00210 [Candidatus Aenigmarchaeota archaeon]|nr:hypothetical protein [Candidatus Aenigmarchaeota archaeon]
MKSAIFLFLAIILLAPASFSHEEAKSNFVRFDFALAGIAGLAALLILTAISMLYGKKAKDGTKKTLMAFFILAAIGTTLYLAGGTVYTNMISETGGPVHWHADFEIWNCGTKLDLIDPTGLSNRVGSSEIHEHGDDRIHVEGVLIRKNEASLHHFFELTGSEFTNDHLMLQTNGGYSEMTNGQTCNGKVGKLQAFLYRITNPNTVTKTGFIYEQVKLDNAGDYVLSPYINVPPGDCIIIEFGEEKNSTDKICETYRIAIERGDVRGG